MTFECCETGAALSGKVNRVMAGLNADGDLCAEFGKVIVCDNEQEDGLLYPIAVGLEQSCDASAAAVVGDVVGHDEGR